MEDATGAIWIGTFGNGLNRYNPQTKKITYYPNFKDPVSGMQTGTAWCACNSSDGTLWIGYLEGVYRINLLQKELPYFETGAHISGIYEDASAVLWYGGYLGLVRKERRTGTEQRYTHNRHNKSSISSNGVYTIFEDRRNTLWIGADNGLNRFDRQTGAFTRYAFNPKDDSSITNGSVSTIYEDSRATLWIGTEGGLNKMNRNAGTFTHYRNNPKDSNSLSGNDISAICEDRSGNLWISAFEKGLNRFIPHAGTFRHFLRGTNILSLRQDAEGILWVGTLSGLYRSNTALNQFSLFIDPDGEMSTTVMVNSILEDNEKALWLNTSLGICKLNRQRNKIVNYTRSSEQKVFLWSRCYKSRKGELFFGGNTGYYAFFPEQITDNAKPPQLVINAFRLADEIVMPGSKSWLKSPLSQTAEIRLRHNQNVFSFDFAGIHYSNPDKNRHFFMLEGLDKSWRKAGEEKTAYYYNVPPGRYTFRIKASNSDGVWAKKSVSLIILPPWWRTWWAYVLFALTVAGFVYAFAQYHINKIRMRHEILLQKNKAAELEIQALRAQMNPHFIFNSLSSINHFILKNDKAQASRYLTKFSRLVRLILQNSQAAFVSLESDLEALQLYLELEALRFGHRFSYQIVVAPRLDVLTIRLPPLLIQPYAENAIWHGLMHKETKGHLTIEVYQQEDMLCCKVTDDGIGRKKSLELQSGLVSAHKPTGMHVTANRIALLQQNMDAGIGINITDLVAPDGRAAGTEVFFKIPIRYD